MINKEKTTKLLTAIGIVAALLFCLSCVGMAYAVTGDNSWFEVASGWGLMLTLTAMAVCFVGLLCLKKWILAFVVLGGAGFSLAIGFLTAILIGAGQHHAPRQDQLEVADIDWGAFYLDGQDERCRLLGADIEKGSWWTDGMNYYRVTATQPVVRMEGMTLHEGGMVTALQLKDDTLRVVLPREGYTTFAQEGCWVTHHLLTDDDDASVTTEILVAYEPDSSEPVAVLQRFDGDELAYEQAAIHRALQGTYRERNGKRQWTFHADGTCALTEDADDGQEPEAKPYAIERFYHQLTNVLQLPDGHRVAVLLDENTLLVYAATYHAEDEEWVQEDEPFLQMDRMGAQDDWLFHHLFSQAVTNVLSFNQLAMLSDRLLGYDIPMACLNRHFMQRIEEEVEEE